MPANRTLPVEADVAPDGAPGPGDAFDHFYGASVDEAVRVAALLTSSRDDAHDLVHDAYVGLLRRWDSVDDPQAYLRRSIANGAAKVYRQRSSAAARFAALRSLRVEGSNEPSEYLADLVERLPYKQRAVVVLKFYLQLGNTEIADLLGMATGSVGPTCGRALERLRRETTP